MDPKFQQFTRKAGADDEAAGSGDDDVMLEKGQDIALNTVCPITAKQVCMKPLHFTLAACCESKLACAAPVSGAQTASACQDFHILPA